MVNTQSKTLDTIVEEDQKSAKSDFVKGSVCAAGAQLAGAAGGYGFLQTSDPFLAAGILTGTIGAVYILFNQTCYYYTKPSERGKTWLKKHPVTYAMHKQTCQDCAKE